MRSLRARFIFSHLLPVLLLTPLLAIVLIFVLESQVILVNLSSQLVRQASVLATVAAENGVAWRDPQHAATFVERFAPRLTAHLMLLTSDGVVLATSDPNSAPLVGQRLPHEDMPMPIERARSIELTYSQNLTAEIADIVVPITTDGSVILGYVRLTQKLEPVRERFQRLRTFVIWILFPGLILAGIVGIVLAQRLEKPLEQLSHRLHTMAADESLKPIPEQGPLEMQLVVQAFNRLVKRLQKLETHRRQLLAGLVHEIGRPLGALRTALDALQSGADEEPILRRSLLKGMNRELLGLQRLLSDLAQVYHPTDDHIKLFRRPVEMGLWLNEITAAWAETARRKGLIWELELPPELPELALDPERLGQALGNLLSNAVKFTPPGGTISLQVHMADNTVTLRIQDSGPGISVEDQSEIFVPFFRSPATRERYEGMGLGLAIARDIVNAHDGSLRVDSLPGQGSTFSIHLPLHTKFHLGNP